MSLRDANDLQIAKLQTQHRCAGLLSRRPFRDEFNSNSEAPANGHYLTATLFTP